MTCNNKEEGCDAFRLANVVVNPQPHHHPIEVFYDPAREIYVYIEGKDKGKGVLHDYELGIFYSEDTSSEVLLEFLNSTKQCFYRPNKMDPSDTGTLHTNGNRPFTAKVRRELSAAHIGENQITVRFSHAPQSRSLIRSLPSMHRAIPYHPSHTVHVMVAVK